MQCKINNSVQLKEYQPITPNFANFANFASPYFSTRSFVFPKKVDIFSENIDIILIFLTSQLRKFASFFDL